MASIALRTYSNEIGDMIDHQQIEESISHCRHILELYPKHVDTYRLLGKAFLEEKRYGDASDILQRVLSSIPEDFIAHVGMSIIREDEGNLDAAIYHMELAFETQPSNHAIQEELRRLQTNRDGIEPPRIRLTRGALARMYAHGHLYDQAIAELLAALSEDAQRFDLQTLLAEMYYQTGKKVDAAETCTKILEKLPFCLKANELLSIILEENDRADDAARYRQKWEALEPYAAFVDQDYTTPDMVPENRIKIERLDWEPSDLFDRMDDQPDWASSLGVSIDRDKGRSEEIPSWIGEDFSSDDETMPGFAEEEEEFADDFFSKDDPLETAILDDLEDEPEDWFSETEADDSLGLFEEETQEPQPDFEDEKEFDFLGSLKTGPEDEEPLPDFLSVESSEDEDWMAEFAIPEDADTPSGKDETIEIKHEELSPRGLGQTEETQDFEAEEQEEDDWLASLGADFEAEEDLEEETAPDDDWFASLEAADEDQPSAEEAEEEQEEEDWLASLGAAAEAEEELEDETAADDDWFASLGAADEDQPSTEEDDEEQEAEDWLASLGAAAEVEEDLEEATAADDDWFASLGAADEDQPSAEEAEEEQDAVDLPDFLKTAGWEKSSGELDESALVDFETEDQQLDELEQADIPDWIRDMAPQEESEPLSPKSEFPVEADPEWLEEIEQQPEAPAPDWLSELNDAEPTSPIEGETAPTKFGQEVEADDMDMAWLESLAAKHGVPDEELVTSPEQRADVGDHHPEERGLIEEDTPSEEAEDWMASLDEPADEEAPDWLSGLDTEAEAPTPSEVTAEEDFQAVLEEEDDFDMDWLDEISQEAAEEAAATSMEVTPEQEPEPAEQAEETEDWMASLDEQADEAAPDWLSGLDTETEAPSPTEGEAVEEDFQPVLEEKDDFDTDWLREIGEQASEEAAATSMEELSPEDLEDQPGDETAAWLSAVGSEFTEEQLPGDMTTGTLLSSLEDSTEEMQDFELDWQEESSDQMGQEPQPERDAIKESEPETSHTVEEMQLEEEPFPDEEMLQEDILATQAEEWQPESQTEPGSQAEAAVEEESTETAPAAADPHQSIFESARAAADKGRLDEALTGFNTLVKKGRLVNEVIEEISDALRRYPVNVELWQLLGDAYLRLDNLQEALDAYTNAEELLR